MFKRIVLVLSLLILQTYQVFAADPGRIALVQYDADKNFNNYELNKKNLTRMAFEAIDKEAKIIVFPEGSLYGYNSKVSNVSWCRQVKDGCLDVSAVAEEVPLGDSTKYWAEISIKNKVYIFFNLPEKSGEQYFNTTVVVGPNGYIGKYHKRKLFRPDMLYAEAGEQNEDFILRTEYGKFGLLICMDVTFPGFLEQYQNKNLDGVILMMNWGHEVDSQYYAINFIRKRATAANMIVYAADMSPWDGTGKYEPNKARERGGLPKFANGVDGISYHEIGEP